MLRSIMLAAALIAQGAAFAASQSTVSVKSLSFRVEDLDTSDFAFPQFRPFGSWTVYEAGFDPVNPNEVFSKGRLFDVPFSAVRTHLGASANVETSAQRASYDRSGVTYSSDLTVAGNISHAQADGVPERYYSAFYVRGPWEGSSGIFSVGPKTRLTITARVELFAETTLGGIANTYWFEYAGASLNWDIYGMLPDQTAGVLASGENLVYASATPADWDPVLLQYKKWSPQSKSVSFDVVATFENNSAVWRDGSIRFRGKAWGGSDISAASAVPEPSILALWAIGVAFLGIWARRGCLFAG